MFKLFKKTQNNNSDHHRFISGEIIHDKDGQSVALISIAARPSAGLNIQTSITMSKGEFIEFLNKCADLTLNMR